VRAVVGSEGLRFIRQDGACSIARWRGGAIPDSGVARTWSGSFTAEVASVSVRACSVIVTADWGPGLLRHANSLGVADAYPVGGDGCYDMGCVGERPGPVQAVEAESWVRPDHIPGRGFPRPLVTPTCTCKMAEVASFVIILGVPNDGNALPGPRSSPGRPDRALTTVKGSDGLDNGGQAGDRGHQTPGETGYRW